MPKATPFTWIDENGSLHKFRSVGAASRSLGKSTSTLAFYKKRGYRGVMDMPRGQRASLGQAESAAKRRRLAAILNKKGLV